MAGPSNASHPPAHAIARDGAKAARKDSVHAFPAFLPDGRHFLYLVRAGGSEDTGIYLGSLDSRPEQQPSKRLVATSLASVLVPSPGGKNGAILFEREGTLLAQPFDLRRLEITGEAVPVADQLGSYLAWGFFSASDNGTLVYRGDAGGSMRLAWLDRQGRNLGAVGDPHGYRDLSLSPEGARVAAVRTEDWDIWLTDLSRPRDTRFTFDPARERTPVWSPDGSRVAFASDRAGRYNLYQHAADGGGQDELLLQSDHTKYVNDWSRDGRSLLYEEIDPKGKFNLWVLPMDGASGPRKPVPLLRTAYDERNGKFSPDGSWVAYESNESGRYEIYVLTFPASAAGGGKSMVSRAGGTQPHWRDVGGSMSDVYQSLAHSKWDCKRRAVGRR
jgi:WD40 repeat protein